MKKRTAKTKSKNAERERLRRIAQKRGNLAEAEEQQRELLLQSLEQELGEGGLDEDDGEYMDDESEAGGEGSPGLPLASFGSRKDLLELKHSQRGEAQQAIRKVLLETGASPRNLDKLLEIGLSAMPRHDIQDGHAKRTSSSSSSSSGDVLMAKERDPRLFGLTSIRRVYTKYQRCRVLNVLERCNDDLKEALALIHTVKGFETLKRRTLRNWQKRSKLKQKTRGRPPLLAFFNKVFNHVMLLAPSLVEGEEGKSKVVASSCYSYDIFRAGALEVKKLPEFLGNTRVQKLQMSNGKHTHTQ